MKRFNGTIRRLQKSRLLLLAVPLAFTLTGCAGSARAAPAPSPDPTPDARGVPGFDTREYPGDATMIRWLEDSPYRWVGFYLPAPCYTGTSWEGKRAGLQDMGWGLAVLFVGEQDWPEVQEAESAGAAARPAPPEAGDRCTRDNLSGDRGRADGAAAAAAASTQGFAPGTVVYLDVEPVEAISDSLAAYITGWTRGLLADGYRPGLYAHARNAETLRGIMAGANGDGAAAPRLWVASPGGFSLRRAPAESGFSATIWQGVLDTHETWGGTRLRIDQNVADRRNPSGG